MSLSTMCCCLHRLLGVI